ncbi:MAG: hypothetical protein ACI4JN_10785, partial [Ruminococcus sp.]
MKTGTKIIAVIVCAAVAAGSGMGGFMLYRSNQQQKHKVDVIPVSNVMEQYWGDEITMDGSVIESNTQSIVLSSNLLVDKVLVEEGDFVKKGTPLLEYDMTAVELDLAQKKTALAVAEDNVRQAKKELERLKSLRPSEEAPVVPDYPVFPDFPDEPAPEVTENTLKEITDVIQAAKGSGTANDPYQFACSGNTVVRKVLLEQLLTEGKYAVFVVYDGSGYGAYAWMVSHESLSGAPIEDWILGANVVIKEDGGIQIRGGGVWYGIIQVGGSFDYDPIGEVTDVPTEPESTEPTEIPSESPTETTEESTVPTEIVQPLSFITPLAAKSESEDYMYSRAELKYKISQQEVEIRSLELTAKKAEIEYETALDKKQNPQEKAKIDGIVSKVAQSEEELEVGEPYLVVRGEGGVMIQGNISETYLDKIGVGSVVMVNSWETGVMVAARITEIDKTPSSYDYQNYGQNPNNSLYPFRASVEESCDLTIGNYVSISFSDETYSNSFYIPMSYVRQSEGQYYVMKESEGGKLEKQVIQTGKI